MKKVIMIATMAAMTVGTQAALAQNTEVKQAGAFFTSAIAGAVIGGPVGFLAGAMGGVWLGEELKQAGKASSYEHQLALASDQIVDLNTQLAQAQQLTEKYASIAVQPLELQMLFKTNQSELTSSGQQRVALLAEYLSKHTDVSVQLDGFADPRGSSEDNLRLSKARVEAIATELEQYGLDPQRITTYSHGASLSQATEGDLDAYALERVVKIKLQHNTNNADVAQTYVAY